MFVHESSIQGKRPYQEDRYIVKKYLSNTSNNSIVKTKKSIVGTGTTSETENMSRLPIDFLGIFDGHGGPTVSETLSKTLPQYFYKQNILSDNIPRPHSKYNEYIINTFDQIQNELSAKHNKSSSQGSTVCLALIYYSKEKKYLTTIWSGDSRVIGCNNNYIAESLTLDHKPDSPSEMLRIKKLGGTVTFEPNDVPRVDGILAVSRSMGDFEQKKTVTHRPDILHYNCNNYKFIVVASDGLYDSMNNQQIVDFILNAIIERPESLSNQNSKNNLNIASKLALKAMELGSDDNISIIIYFNDNKFFN